MFESLLRRDPLTGQFQPGLADRWEWSKDRSSITFHLRSGLKWSDGFPLTTDDIVFTLKAHEDPEFKSLYVGVFSELLKEYEKLSDTSIRFRFRKPSLSNLKEIGLLLMVYPKHIYESDKKKNRIHATSGPFQAGEFHVGKVLKLKHNPHWYGWGVESLKDLYSYKELEFHSSGGERDLFEMLQQGKIDYFQSLDPKQFYQFSKDLNKSGDIVAVKAEGYKLLGVRVISVNHRKPGLGDLRVRKALMHGFDRKLVNEKFFYGLLEPGKGPWPLNHPLAAGEGVAYEFDPSLANRLLDEAGWKQNKKDGVREKKVNGKLHRLEFEILDYDKNNEPLLTFFREAARDIGVKISIKLTGFTEAMRLLKEKEFDLSFHQAQWTSADPNLRFWYFSDPGDNPYLNMGGFKDPELDTMILGIENSFDPGERQRLYHQAYQRIARQLPDLFWFHDRYVFYLVNSRIQRPRDVLPFQVGLSHWKLAQD